MMKGTSFARILAFHEKLLYYKQMKVKFQIYPY
jgi:hypothetical protein